MMSSLLKCYTIAWEDQAVQIQRVNGQIVSNSFDPFSRLSPQFAMKRINAIVPDLPHKLR